jgi:hypothetical protein
MKRKPSNSDDGFVPPKDDMTDPNPDANPNPGDTKLPPIPSEGTSPFDTESKPSTPPVAPPARPAPGGPGASMSSPSVPSSLMEMPALPSTSPTTSNEPVQRPGSIALYPEDATLTSNVPTDRPDLGPLPNAPTPEPYTPGTGVGFVSASTPTSNGAETVIGRPVPTQAPKRRSLLSQLFGRNNTATQNR